MRCQIYLGVGWQFGRKREKITTAISPDTHPLVTYETAARTGKRYILTIIYENIGDCELPNNMAAASLLCTTLAWPAAMYIYWNKIKGRSNKSRGIGFNSHWIGFRTP